MTFRDQERHSSQKKSQVEDTSKTHAERQQKHQHSELPHRENFKTFSTRESRESRDPHPWMTAAIYNQQERKRRNYSTTMMHEYVLSLVLERQ